MDYKKKYLKYKLKYLTAKKLYGGSSDFMDRTGVNVETAITDLYEKGYNPDNLERLGYNINIAKMVRPFLTFLHNL